MRKGQRLVYVGEAYPPSLLTGQTVIASKVFVSRGYCHVNFFHAGSEYFFYEHKVMTVPEYEYAYRKLGRYLPVQLKLESK